MCLSTSGQSNLPPCGGQHRLLILCVPSYGRNAEHLDKPEDAAEFRRFSRAAERLPGACINSEYSLDTDRQSLLVRLLALNLLTEEQITFAKDRLIQAMKTTLAFGYRLSLHSFHLECADGDRHEYAYKLLENEKFPAGSPCRDRVQPLSGRVRKVPIPKGSWAGSLNHYSKGSVVEWLFEKMWHRMDENHLPLHHILAVTLHMPKLPIIVFTDRWFPVGARTMTVAGVMRSPFQLTAPQLYLYPTAKHKRLVQEYINSRVRVKPNSKEGLYEHRNEY